MKITFYNLFMGLTTYFYRGYNPFTKYHGHPSIAKRSESEMDDFSHRDVTNRNDSKVVIP